MSDWITDALLALMVIGCVFGVAGLVYVVWLIKQRDKERTYEKYS